MEDLLQPCPSAIMAFQPSVMMWGGALGGRGCLDKFWPVLPAHKLYKFQWSPEAKNSERWKDLERSRNPCFVPKKTKGPPFLGGRLFQLLFSPLLWGKISILPFFLGDGLKPPPIWFCSSCLLVLGVRFMETTRNLLSK